GPGTGHLSHRGRADPGQRRHQRRPQPHRPRDARLDPPRGRRARHRTRPPDEPAAVAHQARRGAPRRPVL
ncbi:MAG: hypothetical protein AVDCRST_MAG34-117, partial [uncultured Nocardioidaceae bacterium]